RMAAAMGCEPEYVTDIVSCPTLGACAGRVGWPYGRANQRSALPAAQRVIVTAGDPTTDVVPWSTESQEWHGIGAGADDLARRITRDGLDALADIEPPFAGFLMDQRRRACVLFNDRYGIERLFVQSGKGRVVFASEAKAIVAVVPKAGAVDTVGLAEWLACGC